MQKGEIKTLYKEPDKITPIFPVTTVKAVSDTSGKTLDKILEDKYATKNFVSMEIARAQIGGGDGDVDLDGYATKDYVADAIKKIDFPVDSVNGQTGAIQLTAEMVGARPDTWSPQFFQDPGVSSCRCGLRYSGEMEDPKYLAAWEFDDSANGQQPNRVVRGIGAEQARNLIGAAPSGYGLGEAIPPTLTTMDAVDQCRITGFYRYAVWKSTVCNVAVNYGSLAVYNVYSGECIQELRPLVTNYLMRRWCGGDGVWSEWEIDNPPMELEVEYRTTERWMGKPVYTKLSNVGTTESAGGKHFSAPNIDKLIRIVPNVDGYTPMEWDSSGTGASVDNSFYFLPERISSGVTMYVVCGANRVGKPLYVQAWYTKTT